MICSSCLYWRHKNTICIGFKYHSLLDENSKNIILYLHRYLNETSNDISCLRSIPSSIFIYIQIYILCFFFQQFFISFTCRLTRMVTRRLLCMGASRKSDPRRRSGTRLGAAGLPNRSGTRTASNCTICKQLTEPTVNNSSLYHL